MKIKKIRKNNYIMSSKLMVKRITNKGLEYRKFKNSHSKINWKQIIKN